MGNATTIITRKLEQDCHAKPQEIQFVLPITTVVSDQARRIDRHSCYDLLAFFFDGWACYIP